MQFPVVIVDDEESDRLIARKRFERSANSERFNILDEFTSGDSFIERYDGCGGMLTETPPPVLVLMDINMPGRNGFETIEEMTRRIKAGDAEDSVVIMVFTSSQNTKDIERAKSLDLVRGYVVKPFDDGDIASILEFMEEGSREFLIPNGRIF